MSTIDKGAAHPTKVAYDAGYAHGKQAAMSHLTEYEAGNNCTYGMRNSEDGGAYKDGFWEAYGEHIWHEHT